MYDIFVALLVIIGSVTFAVIVEKIYYSYLDTFPKDKRDELIKKQSEMRCFNCGSYEFEVIGLKREKLQFQCKCCKKIW